MDIKKFVSVDKNRICSVVEERENYYICNGECFVFKVDKNRCETVDDEFGVIANTVSMVRAISYAREKGYLKQRGEE